MKYAKFLIQFLGIVSYSSIVVLKKYYLILHIELGTEKAFIKIS